MNGFLEKILARKKQEVVALKKKCSLSSLRAEVENTCSTSRSFKQALEKVISPKQTAIIAEIKQASPSAGILRHDFNPIALAKTFDAYGASCISVLTDEHFFKGKSEDLSNAKAVTTIPILRKDFIVDPIQVWESKKMGADAILLIIAALPPSLSQDLMGLSKSLFLDVLLEVHSPLELESALRLDTSAILGINNRNLNTFKVSLKTTLELLPLVPSGRLVVSESGIKTRADIECLQEAGARAFLVGEALLTENNPGEKLAKLLK